MNTLHILLFKSHRRSFLDIFKTKNIDITYLVVALTLLQYFTNPHPNYLHAKSVFAKK